MNHGLLPTFGGLLLVAALVYPALAQPAGPRTRPDRNGGNPSRVCEQVAEAVVHTLDGAPTRLSAVWPGNPVVLVTASITCGPACAAMPDLTEIRQRFGDRVGVFVLCVQEAHPGGEVSPYCPNQPPRPPNENDGRRQPCSPADCLGFARDFSRTYATAAQIVVDSMDNIAWVAVGKRPNLGLHVGTGGKLLFKLGWFNSDRLLAAVADHLGENPATL